MPSTEQAEQRGVGGEAEKCVVFTYEAGKHKVRAWNAPSVLMRSMKDVSPGCPGWCQQGVTQSWSQVFLRKLQSGRKVKCPNSRFSLIFIMTLGNRHYLYMTDEEAGPEKGSDVCKVT